VSETLEERRRRKSLAGALDQIAGMLGGLAGAALAAGVIAPLVAVATSAIRLPVDRLGLIVAVALLVGFLFGGLAIFFKARSKRLDDDRLADVAVDDR
jgi:hypothetical protein